MTKKPVAKKRAATKGRITVSGGIHAGRDVIMGDQYNDFRQQIAQIASPEEFLARAQELQAMLANVKKEPDLLPEQAQTIEVAESQVKAAVEEAQKPQPLAARINATLTGAKAVMDSLGESVKSAVGLGTVIGGLAQIASKLFGG